MNSYNFKGDLDDFPLMYEYGKKVDAFRALYSDYLWNGIFRGFDRRENRVFAPGAPIDYSVFLHAEPEQCAVVLINDDRSAAHEVTLEGDQPHSLSCASPESPELQPCGPRVTVPARSALVVFVGG